jgi:multidrug efflux system membrane fusion protein
VQPFARATGIWLVTAAAAGTAIAACSNTRSKGAHGVAAHGERVVPVQIAPAVRRDVPVWLDGLGTVAGALQVLVRPQVDGRLDQVLFKEGQVVKKGDVLAQIDPRPWQIQRDQAEGALARDKAQHDAYERDYKRDLDLLHQKLIAQTTVDDLAGQVGQSDGAMKIDQAQIENANLMLDYARIKAPIDGVTGVRLVDPGNLVHAADTTGLVMITSIDPVAVYFTVPQDDLESVAEAQAHGQVDVEVWNRDESERIGQGTLAVLDNQVNTTTATLRLKASVPNPQRALWPGAFVKARMLVETRKDALVVPAVAIQHGPDGTFVYVVGGDSTAQMKPVTVSLTTGDLAVIAHGIAAGDQVVVDGGNQLRPGAKVAPVKPHAPKLAG